MVLREQPYTGNDNERRGAKHVTHYMTGIGDGHQKNKMEDGQHSYLRKNSRRPHQYATEQQLHEQSRWNDVYFRDNNAVVAATTGKFSTTGSGGGGGGATHDSRYTPADSSAFAWQSSAVAFLSAIVVLSGVFLYLVSETYGGGAGADNAPRRRSAYRSPPPRRRKKDHTYDQLPQPTNHYHVPYADDHMASSTTTTATAAAPAVRGPVRQRLGTAATTATGVSNSGAGTGIGSSEFGVPVAAGTGASTIAALNAATAASGGISLRTPYHISTTNAVAMPDYGGPPCGNVSTPPRQAFLPTHNEDATNTQQRLTTNVVTPRAARAVHQPQPLPAGDQSDGSPPMATASATAAGALHPRRSSNVRALSNVSSLASLEDAPSLPAPPAPPSELLTSRPDEAGASSPAAPTLRLRTFNNAPPQPTPAGPARDPVAELMQSPVRRPALLGQQRQGSSSGSAYHDARTPRIGNGRPVVRQMPNNAAVAAALPALPGTGTQQDNALKFSPEYPYVPPLATNRRAVVRSGKIDFSVSANLLSNVVDEEHGHRSGTVTPRFSSIPSPPRSVNLNQIFSLLNGMERGDATDGWWRSQTDLTAEPAPASEVASGEANHSELPPNHVNHNRGNVAEVGSDSLSVMEGAIDFATIELQEEIGGGGFATVYKARHLGTPVAVKLLNGASQSRNIQRKILEEFVAEINLLRGLRHPNICLYLGACWKPPHRAIVTELAENGSLWDALRLPLNAPWQVCDGRTRRGWPEALFAPDPRHGAPPSGGFRSVQASVPPEDTWPWALIQQVALTVARGMAYLHHHGSTPILHRDLKSANILLDRSYVAKVCDFGLSRLKAQERSMTGNCGTVQWMAPEVLRSESYNEKADVYSYGICLWECLTRECPYEGMQPIQCAIAVLNRNERPEIPRWCPPAFQRLIRSCVKAEHTERPRFLDIITTIESMPTSDAPSSEASVNG